MENVQILHGDIFHGNPWRNFHGIPWRFFTRRVAPQWLSLLRERCKVQNVIINRIHVHTFEGGAISEGLIIGCILC